MLNILIKRLTTRRELRSSGTRTTLKRFCAVDGSHRVMIEIRNEEDARYLCEEFGWQFIEMCDD